MDLNRWIITGWRGSGKSSFCQAMVDQARQAGWKAAGIISPARERNGIKEFIDAVALSTGEKRLLAAAQRQTGEDFEFGDWFFNQETLAWGNEVIANSLPSDLLVIDEIGPLEFYFSMGWFNALEVIQRTDFRLALVVIRPELVEAAGRNIQPTQIIRLNGVDDVNSRVISAGRVFQTGSTSQPA